jgi:hypothetical protein
MHLPLLNRHCPAGEFPDRTSSSS